MRYSLFRQPNFRLKIEDSDDLDYLKREGASWTRSEGVRTVILENLEDGYKKKVWDSDVSVIKREGN